jgi:hypothetical protein
LQLRTFSRWNLDNRGNYVLLANTYAAGKNWEEAAKARKFLKEIEVIS